MDIALMSASDGPSDAVPTHSLKHVRMAKRFPRTESDSATLAVQLIDGLTNAAEDFPAPSPSPP